MWTGFPLAERLSAELGVPAVVDNDINAAALGEFHARRQQGRIRPNGDLLFVQLARGLHTGLVLGGAIHRGHEFNAGEIADFLDLRLDEDTRASDSWVTRAALTIASVGAVVDPDAIVISSPSESSRGTVTRVLEALSALRTPSTPSFAAEVSELGWAAGVVGATHLALAAADQALTGTPRPRPVTLTGTSLIQSTLEKGRHTTMTTTPQAPHRTLRVGVVGVGARSGFTLAAELPQNNGRIAAVCDTHPLVAERVRERLGRESDDVVITSTVEELIDAGIDVAFVTTPDDTHAEITCALLEAGVPVYLEKPLATDLDDATRVLTTAFRTGTRLYVGHNMRHMNVVRTMRDIIRAGRIGEVKAIWCRHFVGHGGDYYFKDWHAESARSGGLLVHKACHALDAMSHVLGTSIQQAQAVGTNAVCHSWAPRRGPGRRGVCRAAPSTAGAGCCRCPRRARTRAPRTTTASPSQTYDPRHRVAFAPARIIPCPVSRITQELRCPPRRACHPTIRALSSSSTRRGLSPATASSPSAPSSSSYPPRCCAP